MSNEVKREQERQEIFNEVLDKGLEAVKILIEKNEELIKTIDQRATDEKDKVSRLYLLAISNEHLIDTLQKIKELKEGKKQQVIRLVLSEEDKKLIKQQLRGA